MKNKLIATFLCSLMLLSLAGCEGSGGGQSDPTPNSADTQDAPGANTPNSPENASIQDASVADRDTLYVAATQDNGTLDPLGVSGSGGFLHIATCYMEPLWDFRSGWEIVWILATGVDEISSTQLTVHLREGVTFSNGNPFTADDVLFTFELWRDTPNRATTLNQVDFEKNRRN